MFVDFTVTGLDKRRFVVRLENFTHNYCNQPRADRVNPTVDVSMQHRALNLSTVQYKQPRSMDGFLCVYANTSNRSQPVLRLACECFSLTLVFCLLMYYGIWVCEGI